MASAPTPFPEGDPRNAKYSENIAALEHQKGLIEAEDKRLTQEAESSYKYGTEQLGKAEPLALRANMNRANTEGLAQSGVLAGRQGQTQVQYQGKEHAIGETRRKAVEAYSRADARAREGFAEKSAADLKQAQKEAQEELLRNPPATPPTQAYNPGGTREITGATGPGGVQPYTEQTPGGFVRVGAGVPANSGIKWSRNPATREKQAREYAARQAVG